MKSIYYKQDDEEGGWRSVDDKDVPDMLANGEQLLTSEGIIDLGFVDGYGHSPAPNYRYGGPYYDKEAIKKRGEEVLERFKEHLAKKRKSTFVCYNPISNDIREMFKDVLKEGQGYYLDLKDEVTGKKPKLAHIHGIIESLIGKLDTLSRTVTDQWGLTGWFKFEDISPYIRFKSWVTIVRDLHLPITKEIKDLALQGLKLITTHKWSKGTERHKDMIFEELTKLSKMKVKK